MNDDDDLSKTMVIPNPGGRRKVGEVGQPAQSIPPQHGGPPHGQPPQHITQSANTYGNIGDASANMPRIETENILLSCADDILVLAGSLRTLEPNNTIEQLRRDIEALFAKLDKQLTDHSLPQEVTLTARYLLCCLIDELVLSTPWGLDSAWSHQTLLGKYHNETSGGEKFFLIANKLMEQPQRNIDLIELCYVCLSMGFRGKYRLSQTGENDIVQISQMLYQPITLYRPVVGDLSPAWQGISDDKPSLEKRVPPILFFMILAFICIAAYIAFLSNLHAKASPLYQKVEGIGWSDVVLQIKNNQAPEVKLPDVATQLRSRLSQSIADNKLVVDIKDGMLIVRLVSTQLFPSGSAKVNKNELPEVNVLVDTLNQYASSVIIVGHTDSTGRADSNWVISRKRATAVEAWLNTANTPPSQTLTRGVADTQPLVDDANSDFNQSLNRRVELILVVKDELAP
ncbi:type IVB secretion system protein IcmH/DotU [Agaribacter marinus]|uniref:Flagellar motor protein n=1 Tax=Agaribacter marinus TaxID=1431249 RepID=A0AA37T0Y6_9ALTE|nr:type IVB secretion system protein IcmH/DotU [Agaribacter marinus]GLR71904.1 flagellar motor protein [Agaribacter marinus]